MIIEIWINVKSYEIFMNSLYNLACDILGINSIKTNNKENYVL